MAVGSKELAPVELDTFEDDRLVDELKKAKEELWINIYPDRPLTKKPAETRMGSGKGSPEWWVANVKPGRVLFEVAGVNEELAREALLRAIHTLPLKARIIKREEGDA